MGREVKPVLTPKLREVRRGERDDELELIDEAGGVTIVVAYGVNAPERARVRETALRLLSERSGPVH